ncbi:unnamed protein product [Effrenium voratum]|nr:unnamed protein product [Effrenium voratum]
MLPYLCEILEGGVSFYSKLRAGAFASKLSEAPCGEFGRSAPPVRSPWHRGRPLGRRVAGQALAAALAGHRGLRDLNLDANGFGDAGAEAGERTRELPPWLWVLAPHGSACAIWKLVLELLLKALEAFPSPKWSWVWGRNPGSKGSVEAGGGAPGAEAGGWGQALGAALQQMPRLQTLKLSQNQIGVKGAQALARGLEGTTALELLWLWENRIGDAGCEALGVALQQMPRLQTLILSQNQIGVKGAQALARGLEANASLEVLWLFQNSLGDEGCKALAAALAHRGLRDLDLAANGFGDAGAEAGESEPGAEAGGWGRRGARELPPVALGVCSRWQHCCFCRLEFSDLCRHMILTSLDGNE